jgi:beta-glucosidase
MVKTSIKKDDTQLFEYLHSMSLPEKIQQMHGIKGLHSATPWTYRWHHYQTPDNKRLGIQGLIFTDGPRGINLGHSTAFPAAIARGASWDTELETRIGTAMGLEAYHQGANCCGALCINIIRHPGWGRAQESYGADSVLLGKMGSALVRGLQKNVIAVVKHFALNSIENNRFRVDVQITEKRLREDYLPHFKECIDVGAGAIMSAYNKVNGDYCGENAHLLKHILKQEWGFNGFVMSDFLLGTRSTAKAILNGLDIEMPQKFYFSIPKIKMALKRGLISETDIDQVVLRILRIKDRFGLIGEKKVSLNPKKVVACESHIKLALESARKSCVLLKNDNSFLPLKQHLFRRLAVIGKLADKANLGSEGSTSVSPPSTENLLSSLKNLLGTEIEIIHAKGGKKAVKLAQNVDIVIIATGLSGRDEGEYFPFLGGGDRIRLELSRKDENIIREIAAVNPNTVVVLYGGSAIACGSWLDTVPAILMAWYPGMKGGTAIAEILFGQINPSGKLPISFPNHTSELPVLDNRNNKVSYDETWDYRYYDQKGIIPHFAFGHGLSYSQFHYQNLEAIVESNHISIKILIHNKSNVSGEEIVQVYIAQLFPNHPVIKELKAFKRIFIHAEMIKEVVLNVSFSALKKYNDRKNEWGWETDQYRIMVGGCSAILPLTCDIQLDRSILESNEDEIKISE